GSQGLGQVTVVLPDHRPEVVAAHTGALLQAIVGSRGHAVAGVPVGGVHDLHPALGTHGGGDDVARSINISVAGFGQGHGTSQKLHNLRVYRHRSLLSVVDLTALTCAGCPGTSGKPSTWPPAPADVLERGQFLLVLRLNLVTCYADGLDPISRTPGHNLG